MEFEDSLLLFFLRRFLSQSLCKSGYHIPDGSACNECAACPEGEIEAGCSNYWECAADNEWHFNQTLAGRVPNEGVSRLITSSKRQFKDHTIRRGLAFIPPAHYQDDTGPLRVHGGPQDGGRGARRTPGQITNVSGGGPGPYSFPVVPVKAHAAICTSCLSA